MNEVHIRIAKDSPFSLCGRNPARGTVERFFEREGVEATCSFCISTYKTKNPDQFERLVDLHEIVSMRDGKVWATRSLGHIWVPLESEPAAGQQYLLPSLQWTEENNSPSLFRKVKPGQFKGFVLKP